MKSNYAKPLACLLAASIALPLATAEKAVSQERKSPSILEFFGIRPAKPRVIVVPKAPVKKKVVKSSKAAGRKKPKKPVSGPAAVMASGDPTQPSSASPIVEKSPDAKTVLVVGDFMAGALSEGLEIAFETEAAVRIVDKSSGSSGFVRNDVFNWPQNISTVVAENKPNVLVVMIGTNDRQQMIVAGSREQIQSPAWSEEYEQRVTAFAEGMKATGVPVVWVGLPPFKQQTMSAGILAFNDIYEKKAESISGQFVDIWDGFLDDQGAFTINGFDYTGQPAKLRASDGINLTSAGKRKAAFFAEKPIRLALGALPLVSPEPASLAPFSLPGPVRPESALPENITSLPPISLFDPAFDNGAELMGGAPSAQSLNNALPAAALYQRGEMPKPQPGRIDEIRTSDKISPLPSGETGSIATTP